jgi:hypothetical protein
MVERAVDVAAGLLERVVAVDEDHVEGRIRVEGVEEALAGGAEEAPADERVRMQDPLPARDPRDRVDADLALRADVQEDDPGADADLQVAGGTSARELARDDLDALRMAAAEGGPDQAQGGDPPGTPAPYTAASHRL